MSFSTKVVSKVHHVIHKKHKTPHCMLVHTVLIFLFEILHHILNKNCIFRIRIILMPEIVIQKISTALLLLWRNEIRLGWYFMGSVVVQFNCFSFNHASIISRMSVYQYASLLKRSSFLFLNCVVIEQKLNSSIPLWERMKSFFT